MKVLAVLRKAGLITSEEETDAGAREGGSRAGGPAGADAGGKTPRGSQTLPPPPDEAALAPLAASELVIDFDQIFDALKIPVPEHGWTAEKVRKALASPHFQTLDDAVAALMATAIDKGRSANPALELGICGEHGGDPASIDKCERLGLVYISCSPFRVPSARLAAARASLAAR